MRFHPRLPFRSGKIVRDDLRGGAESRLRHAGCAAVEELERRVLLSAILTNAIASHIDPTTAPQALFPPGVSTFPLLTRAGFRVLGTTFYRFSVDGTAPAVPTTFSAVAGSPAIIDTALALFDADGNLLQSADADTPYVGTETLSANLTSRKPYVLGVYTADLNLFATSPHPVTLTVDTGAQRINSSIQIDPAVGSKEFIANSGQGKLGLIGPRHLVS